MIGWENNQGAYFINELKNAIASTNSKVSDIEGDIDDIEKDIDDIEGDIGDINTAIGNITTAIETPLTAIEGVSSGVTAYGFKVGKIVCIEFSLTASVTANTKTAIAQFDTSILPAYESTGYALSGTYATVGALCKMYLEADGNLSVMCASALSSATVRGTLVYISKE